MNKEFLVYLAGPINGLTYDESVEWRDYVRDNVYKNILTLSPMRAKDFLKEAGRLNGMPYNQHVLSSSKGINTRDYNDVKRSDAVFVNFLGAKIVSIGTVMEIAWCRAFDKPVICCMEEDNIHRHVMLEYACNFILPSLDDGIDTLHSLLLPDKRKIATV